MNFNSRPDLTDKILDKLKDQTTRARSHYTTLNTFRIILILICLVLAVTCVSFFVYDTQLQFEGLSSWRALENDIFSGLLLELLLAFVFLLSGIYWIYRQTDWPGVREFTPLVIMISFSVFGLGYILAEAADQTTFIQSPLNALENTVSQLPYRQSRSAEIDKILARHNLFQGYITWIDIGGQSFRADNATRKFEFTTEINLTNFRVGERVIVKYRQLNSKLLATSIKKVKKQPGFKQAKVVIEQIDMSANFKGL